MYPVKRTYWFDIYKVSTLSYLHLIYIFFWQFMIFLTSAFSSLLVVLSEYRQDPSSKLSRADNPCKYRCLHIEHSNLYDSLILL